MITPTLPAELTVRHNFKPGDLGTIVHLHGALYAVEYGFDATFEAYVAGPMSEFVKARTPRDRIWIVERVNRIVGCIAIVGVSDNEAQLRWFLVEPSARGTGLGKYLMGEAVSFCGEAGFASVFLWTVSDLTTAAHLYRSFGFQKAEDHAVRLWGANVVEEKYILRLG